MKSIKFLSLVLFCLLVVACERVAPNYYGVLMENYGKNGTEDYHFQQGKVSTAAPGTELFQVPGWAQRALVETVLHIKTADNVDMTSLPKYTYEIDKGKDKAELERNVVKLVFQNSRLGSGEGFMKSLEDNVLEPGIYDIIKESSQTIMSDTMQKAGGTMHFEILIQEKVRAYFKERGLKLINFTGNIDFEKNVKTKMNKTSEVNSNLNLLDKKIIEQTKTNELAELEAKEIIIRSKAFTPEYLQNKALDKWNGQLPATYSGTGMPFVKTIK